MGTTTHVRIGEDTADELHAMKSRGDSYDDVIQQLIAESKNKETAAEA